MRQDIKNKELRERQAYVPASVKVIEVTAQRVLCGSGDFDGNGIDNFKLLDDDSQNW